jgi:hypothetical protein
MQQDSGGIWSTRDETEKRVRRVFTDVLFES